MAHSVDGSDATCDITLKGGITSGVLYPPVVCRLAQEYRFVNVGGASAGAIAAAATAAAEYGRQHGVDGYGVLADLPRRLGEAGKSGSTTLLALFEPQRATSPLFRVLTAAQGAMTSPVRRIIQATQAAMGSEIFSSTGWWRILVSTLPWAAVLFIGVFATRPVWVAVLLAMVAVLLAAVGLVVGTAWALLHRLLVEVPRNYMGVVNGSGSAAALTPWLSALIDEASGRVGGRPLTLAELWGADTVERKRACLADRTLRRINLEVTTTNLSEGRPQRVPLLSEEYFFCEREFRELFPERVVKVMLEAPAIAQRSLSEQREFDLITHLARAQGYERMPVADLPIVVAARLSLSFPLLLSAVPLYKVDFSRERTQQAIEQWRGWLADRPHPDRAVAASEVAEALEAKVAPDLPLSRCWLSDGGITSNMPLQFFDAPLPGRPSFAINLRSRHAPRPAPGSPELARPCARLAADNQQGMQGTWNNVDDDKSASPTLLRFVGAIASTMQNWVDNAQMRMPGYRDRIVTVYLWSDQGGMNLDMDKTRIGELRVCGEQAADLLLERFFFPPSEGWRNHRWVRYRSLMAMLQRMVAQLDGAWDCDPGAGMPSYHQMADGNGRPRSYPLPARAQPWVQIRSAELAELAAAWRTPVVDGHNCRSVGSFEDDEPRPRPVWRAQPEL